MQQQNGIHECVDYRGLKMKYMENEYKELRKMNCRHCGEVHGVIERTYANGAVHHLYFCKTKREWVHTKRTEKTS